jgi:hypothetical protein
MSGTVQSSGVETLPPTMTKSFPDPVIL